MIRDVKLVVVAAGSLVVIGLAAILLFWLGRPLATQQRGELVVDPEVDSDDAGFDVDVQP